jgi:hypothetical protein
MNVSRANYVEKAVKIDSVIENLTAAKLAAEDWMSKQAEVPDMTMCTRQQLPKFQF